MQSNEVHVIVVDDELWTAKQISDYVKARGFKNVEFYECPLEAKEKIISINSKVVIVSDYKMPGMTGVELLNSVRLQDMIEGFIITSVPEIVSSRDYQIVEKGQDDKLSMIADLVVKIAKQLAEFTETATYR